MKKTILILLLSLFSATYSSGVLAQKQELVKELTEGETKTLQEGKFVVKIQEIKDSAWPEITYYALIEATPLEAIGLFAAYDIQKDYVPNVIKSKIVKHITATDVHTEYELYVPFPLSNAHYTHGAKLFQHGNDYELTWYMVSSTSTDDVRGSAYFTPSAGKTLFRYRSYIKPKSIFGGLVKKIMFKDVEKTISAIREHIEKLKKENSPLMTKYSEFINRALKGELVYQDQIKK